MRTVDFECICWGCGRTNEAASGRGNSVPDDGAVLVCWICAAPSLCIETPFGLAAVKPSSDELKEILQSEEYVEAYGAITAARMPLEAVVMLERRAASN